MEEDYLLTVKQFAEKFPWPSEAGLRAMIIRTEENGLSEAFVRYGRRVLINPKKFFALVEQKGTKKWWQEK